MAVDRERDRERMVTVQLRLNGIHDERVLRAFARVPRHEFVLEETLGVAYRDQALPIGQGQTISQPFMIATMLELAAPQRSDRVLEVGTGLGYQAALLRELADDVTTIERIEALASEARRRLSAVGYDDITVIHGDGREGAPDRAPFDVIVVAAGSESIPRALLDQLAEGGRLVMPVGGPRFMRLRFVRREGNAFTDTDAEPCIFVPLRPGTA